MNSKCKLLIVLNLLKQHKTLLFFYQRGYRRHANMLTGKHTDANATASAANATASAASAAESAASVLVSAASVVTSRHHHNRCIRSVHQESYK